MPRPEWKILPLTDAKVSSDGNGSLTGYASTFGNIDSYGDTVQPGAYTAYLDEFVENGFIAWNHDWSAMIGTISSAKQDTKGLLITADFHSTSEAQAARTITAERLARGKPVGLSIGYQTTKWSAGEIDGEPVRMLEEIKLFETSLVAVPADSFAGVTGIKAHPFTQRPSSLWFIPGFKAETPTDPPAESDDDDAPDPEARGERYADHLERVLLEVSNLTSRSTEIADLRAKAGRTLSAATRRNLQGLVDQLTELLATTAPKAEDDEPAADEDAAKSTRAEELDALYARFIDLDTLYRDLARPRAL